MICLIPITTKYRLLIHKKTIDTIDTKYDPEEIIDTKQDPDYWQHTTQIESTDAKYDLHGDYWYKIRPNRDNKYKIRPSWI